MAEITTETGTAVDMLSAIRRLLAEEAEEHPPQDGHEAPTAEATPDGGETPQDATAAGQSPATRPDDEPADLSEADVTPLSGEAEGHGLGIVWDASLLDTPEPPHQPWPRDDAAGEAGAARVVVGGGRAQADAPRAADDRAAEGGSTVSAVGLSDAGGTVGGDAKPAGATDVAQSRESAAAAAVRQDSDAAPQTHIAGPTTALDSPDPAHASAPEIAGSREPDLDPGDHAGAGCALGHVRSTDRQGLTAGSPLGPGVTAVLPPSIAATTTGAPVSSAALTSFTAVWSKTQTSLLAPILGATSPAVEPAGPQHRASDQPEVVEPAPHATDAPDQTAAESAIPSSPSAHMASHDPQTDTSGAVDRDAEPVESPTPQRNPMDRPSPQTLASNLGETALSAPDAASTAEMAAPAMAQGRTAPARDGDDSGAVAQRPVPMTSGAGTSQTSTGLPVLAMPRHRHAIRPDPRLGSPRLTAALRPDPSCTIPQALPQPESDPLAEAMADRAWLATLDHGKTGAPDDLDAIDAQLARLEARFGEPAAARMLDRQPTPHPERAGPRRLHLIAEAADAAVMPTNPSPDAVAAPADLIALRAEITTLVRATLAEGPDDDTIELLRQLIRDELDDALRLRDDHHHAPATLARAR